VIGEQEIVMLVLVLIVDTS